MKFLHRYIKTEEVEKKLSSRDFSSNFLTAAAVLYDALLI